MIQHHPDDTLLMTLAAGTLDAGTALVLAAHVEGCRQCRAHVCDYEALGGALLVEQEPALLAPESLARTLEMLDQPSRVATTPAHAAAASAKRAAAAAANIRAQPPAGLIWPRSLAGCSTTPWRWLAPGMRWSRVTVPHDAQANVFMLRIGSGKSLPLHTHSEVELTQILYGSFHDGRALFGPGDFDEADGDIRHQPVVEPGGECICIAAVKGRVVFDGAIARWMGQLVGM